MKRLEAIALLKEITSSKAVIPVWVSLENASSNEYELHIKPENSDSASLKSIVEVHNLELKEVEGFWVIYRNGSVRQRLPKNQKLEVLEQMG